MSKDELEGRVRAIEAILLELPEVTRHRSREDTRQRPQTPSTPGRCRGDAQNERPSGPARRESA